MIKWLVGKIADKVYEKLGDEFDKVFHREITKVKRNEIREAFRAILNEMLSDEGDWKEEPYRDSKWMKGNMKTLRKDIKDSVLAHCAESLYAQEEARVQGLIADEAFVDSVVDRINRKQVGGRND